MVDTTVGWICADGSTGYALLPIGGQWTRLALAMVYAEMANSECAQWKFRCMLQRKHLRVRPTPAFAVGIVAPAGVGVRPSLRMAARRAQSLAREIHRSDRQ